TNFGTSLAGSPSAGEILAADPASPLDSGGLSSVSGSGMPYNLGGDEDDNESFQLFNMDRTPFTGSISNAAAAIPEPSSIALIAIAAATTLRRRKMPAIQTD